MAVGQINFPQYNPNSQIDQGTWGSLSKLGDVYREAQNRQKLSELGKQIAGGSTDYRSAAGQTADMGDLGSTLKFLGLAETRRKQDLEIGASAELGGYFNNAGKPSPQSAAVIPDAEPTRTAAVVSQDPAALPPPAVPVPSTPKVIGTLEGERTGIYEPRAPAPPVAPQPPAAAPAAAPPVAEGAPSPDRVGGAFAQAPGVPSFEEGPKIEHVPFLLKMLPRLPESQQAVVAAAIKQAWDNAKPTTEIATLNALRGDPQLFGIAKQLAEAKSMKSTVTLPPLEKAQDTEMGKTLAELHGGYIKDALKVPQNKTNLDAAERAMSHTNFSSGTFTPAIVAARRALVGIGVLDAENASPNELFTKLQNKAIMDAGGSASGLGPQISNQDAAIIRDSTFNQTNTPAGNRVIIGFQRLLEDRKVDYAKEMNRYANGKDENGKSRGGRIDIGVMEHMSDWAEKNPLNFEKVPGFQPPPDYNAEINKRNELRKQQNLPPLR